MSSVRTTAKFINHPFYVMAIIYVTVKVQVEDDLEPMDVIEECDFELSGDGVISAEICRVDDY